MVFVHYLLARENERAFIHNCFAATIAGDLFDSPNVEKKFSNWYHGT